MRDQTSGAFKSPSAVTLIFLLLIAALLALLHISVLGNAIYWWSPDLAAYIEAARNFSDSGELLVTTSAFATEQQAILRLWPPGYPVALAVLNQLSGVDIPSLTVAMSVVAWVLAPLAMLLLLSPVLGALPALLVVIVTMTSPAFFEFAWRASPDMPFFLLVVVGMLLSFRSLASNRAYGLILLGGVLLGMSFSFRNVGAVACFAVFLSYVLFWLRHPLENGELFKRLIIWGVGVSLVVFPIWIRNIMVFGKIQPYEMEPSTVGLVTNIRESLRISFHDISGLWEVGTLLAWDSAAMAGAVLALFVVSVLIYFKKSWRRVATGATNAQLSGPQRDAGTLRRMMIVALAVYAVLGWLIVIYGRTKYEWGEPINLRHALQYDWAFVALLMVLFGRVLNAGKARIAAIVLAALLLTGHALGYASSYLADGSGFSDVEKMKFQVSENAAIRQDVIEHANAGFSIVSNMHDPLVVSSGVAVRAIYTSRGDTMVSELTDKLLALQRRQAETGAAVRVYIVAEKAVLDALFESQHGVANKAPERLTETLLVFEYGELRQP